MVVTLFKIVGMFGDQMLAITVQNHEERQSITFTPILRNHILVVPVVYVDEHSDIIGLQHVTDGFIALEKVMQFVTPAAPICAELQENAFVFFAGSNDRVRHLLVAVCGFIIKAWWRSRGCITRSGGRRQTGNRK